MSKVLVTGGGGYIGSVLSEMLLSAGHEVRILDRFFFGKDLLQPIASRDGLELLREDVRSVDAPALEGVDVVMHLAGISNDPACDLDLNITQEVNVEGTMRVAKLAKEAGVRRFINASSCSIYGHGDQDRLDEDSPLAPVSLYARTKIEVEARLAELADDTFAVTHMRNATVYGLSYRMRFDLVINLMTLYAYSDRKIFVLGGGKQWRPVIHVRDVARAFMAVMDAEPELVAGQAFNVGTNDQNYQVYGLAQMVRDVVPNTALEVVPDDADKRTYNVSFDKIADVLGFTVEKSPYEGIVEIKQALERGDIEDSVQTRTVNYYRYLLDAERLLKEISLDGRIF